MKKLLENYAFIDSQNLNLGVRRLGWKLDYGKFRIYLKEKYGVVKAYMFIGYLEKNSNLYKSLQEKGFILIFKPVLENKKGEVKGNVDADLVMQAMLDYKKYKQAIIVTSDGDFYCLVKYLYKNKKLCTVLSTHGKTCSYLLKITAKDKLRFLMNAKNKLEYKKRGTS